MFWPMLGLGLIKSGSDYYFSNRMMKSQKKLAKSQHKHAVNQATRFLEQSEEDAARGRRQLLETLNARGLDDSSVKDNDLAYFDRRAGRNLQGARENVSLARKSIDQFKKDYKMQKLMNYLNLGFGVANAGLGAWAMNSMIPSPQIPQTIPAGAGMGGMFGGGPGSMYGSTMGLLYGMKP